MRIGFRGLVGILLLLMLAPPVAAASLRERVAAAHRQLREAMLEEDAAAQLALYRPDAISLPEYQPALFGGEQIGAYLRAMRERRRVTQYAFEAGDVFEFGETAVETGTLSIRWTLADGTSSEERGKYMHVWTAGPGGALRLKADCWGFFRPLDDAASFYVALPPGPARPVLPAGEPALAAALEALDAGMARAVQGHDAEAQIANYAPDGMFMPFAAPSQMGIDAIATHLRTYVDRGRGANFDGVDVWNIGFQDFGSHVLEYSKFRVRWRAGANSGTTSGGGLRLWRRESDGALKLLRQIGTHDYVPQG